MIHVDGGFHAMGIGGPTRVWRVPDGGRTPSSRRGSAARARSPGTPPSARCARPARGRGIDEVVGRLARARTCADLVREPDLPEETERLDELLARSRDRPRRRPPPRAAARSCASSVRPAPDRVRPGEVPDDRDAAVLHVEPPGVLAAGLDDEVAEEAGRRGAGRARAAEVTQEARGACAPRGRPRPARPRRPARPPHAGSRRRSRTGCCRSGPGRPSTHGSRRPSPLSGRRIAGCAAIASPVHRGMPAASSPVGHELRERRRSTRRRSAASPRRTRARDPGRCAAPALAARRCRAPATPTSTAARRAVRCPSSSSRRVSASTTSAITRPTSTGSALASTRPPPPAGARAPRRPPPRRSGAFDRAA